MTVQQAIENFIFAKQIQGCTEKSIKCKEIIKKHALDFGGTLSDKEVMILCKISRNSYYKYKRELKEEMNK